MSIKRVSFSEELCTSDGESSSSLDSSGEIFLPSISSISEYSDRSDVVGSKSSRTSIHSDTRDVKNVLQKKYSKLAFSVKGVRDAQIQKFGTGRKFRR